MDRWRDAAPTPKINVISGLIRQSVSLKEERETGRQEGIHTSAPPPLPILSLAADELPGYCVSRVI